MLGVTGEEKLLWRGQVRLFRRFGKREGSLTGTTRIGGVKMNAVLGSVVRNTEVDSHSMAGRLITLDPAAVMISQIYGRSNGRTMLTKAMVV
jgi:hypothetical protein